MVQDVLLRLSLTSCRWRRIPPRVTVSERTPRYSDVMFNRWQTTATSPAEPVEGLADLVPSQLELLEHQLERQEAAMINRLSNANTRAAILIGASSALGGTELVISSGNPWISGISLTLYLMAAASGLAAMSSRLTEQPDLPALISEYAVAATVSLRRSLLSSRLTSHERSRTQLSERHGWLIRGFIILVAAWLASGVGTIYGLANPEPVPPTTVQIEGADQ